MFNPFKCNHPAEHLVVEKDATLEPVDELFDHITYHLTCTKCGKHHNIKYAKPTEKFYDYRKEK